MDEPARSLEWAFSIKIHDRRATPLHAATCSGLSKEGLKFALKSLDKVPGEAHGMEKFTGLLGSYC